LSARVNGQTHTPDTQHGVNTSAIHLHGSYMNVDRSYRL
jgi:hypothetical protein